MKLIYEHGGFGRIIYSEGEYYHYNVDTAWGYKEWRNALPHVVPHACDGLLHRRHGKRYTAVSCLGYRQGRAILEERLQQPVLRRDGYLHDHEGGMSRMT